MQLSHLDIVNFSIDHINKILREKELVFYSVKHITLMTVVSNIYWEFSWWQALYGFYLC